MTTQTPQQDRIAVISEAVRQVYEEAGFNAAESNSQIVPLYDLIGAYPLRIAAIENLTYQSAIQFLTAEMGQPVMVPNFTSRQLSGLLYVYEFTGLFYGCILIEKSDPIARQRFSAAHELGHYLLHFLPLLERSEQKSARSILLAEGKPANEQDSEDGLNQPEISYGNGLQIEKYQPAIAPEEMEREADQFAAEILMPAPICQSLVQHHLRRRSNIRRQALARRLAPDLLVSQSAMERRLTSLGLPESLSSQCSE